MKNSSILKKVIVAVSGLALVGFLCVHLAGNLLLYAGAESFNGYAHALESKKALLYLAEVVLLAIFLTHIVLAIKVNKENNDARPIAYQAKATAGQSTLASRTMVISGLVVAIFVIGHVYMFKFGDSSGPQGLWGLVVASFQRPLVTAWYLAAMAVLGLHLSHALSSAFQSLGLLQPKAFPKARRAGQVLGWLLALGFATFPLWAFVFKPSPGPNSPLPNLQLREPPPLSPPPSGNLPPPSS